VGAIEGKRFVVMAGLGFDAAIVRDAPERLKNTVGWPAYFVSGAKHVRGRRISVSITIDDGEPLERRVRTVLVGNVGKLQGGLLLLPDARPDDGVLDVAVLSPRNGLDWVRLTGRVLRRKDVPDRRMERFRGKHIVIEASRPQPRQLDGDIIEDGQTMDIEIEAGVLGVRVPR
jgi:diacylglycerol kinase (ATP)